jgi:phage terminase small subunit
MPGRWPSPDSVNTSDKRPKTVSDGIVPSAPKWLNDEAKKIYKATAKDIVALGIAGRCDEKILSIFAMQMARLIEVSKKANKEMSDERLLNDLTAQTLQLAKELGISPSARAKLRIAKIEEDDLMEKILDTNI